MAGGQCQLTILERHKMKRDMDLVRKILLAAEDADGQPDLRSLVSDACDERKIAYHTGLLREAGLVKGIFVEGGLDPGDYDQCFIQSLTWEGHEFLDSARKETIWNAAKQRAMDTVGSLSIESMK